MTGAQEATEVRARAMAAAVRGWLVPRLVREGRDRGWWDPVADAAPGSDPPSPTAAPDPGLDPTILAMDAEQWARLDLAARVVAPFPTGEAHALLGAAIRDGARVHAAVAGSTVVGLIASAPAGPSGAGEWLALGVAPAWRRRGIATALCDAASGETEPEADGEAGQGEGSDARRATITLAERDVVEPLDARLRLAIGRRLLDRAGFAVEVSVP